MSYTETWDQAAEYLRLAVNYMGKYQIPMNPMNYAVWYEYAAGFNAELARTVNSLIEQSTDFTSEINEGLYRRCITEKGKTQQESTLRKIQKLVLALSEDIVLTGGDMSRHGNALEAFRKRLLGDISDDEICSIIANVAVEVKAIIESGKFLENRLDLATREVDQLRMELDEVKEKAVLDSLTGISNRTAFERTLACEAKRVQNVGTELCLLFADIDNFKIINDTHGHLVGDMVLKLSASMIKNLIKGRDLVARYGGEEFVVLLPDTSLGGALQLAERIRAYFETKSWRKKDSGRSLGAVTLSIGAAQLRPGEPLPEFVKRADQAMYLAKRKGRNQVSPERDLA